MSDFCPEGYLTTQDAILRAANYWYPDNIAALQTTEASEAQPKSKNDVEAAVRAFSQPHVASAWQHAFDEIGNQTVQRLRNLLHQGTLNAYYFASDGPHCIPREFWATGNADGVIETGIYWPYGRPTSWHETRPNSPLFLRESELNVLLSKQPAKKIAFPKAKMPALIEALRKLDNLPSRKKQREALRKLPEFERYHLTDDVLREAEKKVPRSPGRKRLDPEKSGSKESR
jgi:hypothetical protein